MNIDPADLAAQDQFWAGVAAAPDDELLTAAAELAPHARTDSAARAVWSAICNELIDRHQLDRHAIQAGPSITDAIRAEIRAAQILRAATN